MSEAARRTYFHFTPTPTPGQCGEWRPTPPASAGLYWVACVPESGRAFVALVELDPKARTATPVGWQLGTNDAKPPSVELDRLQAWWSTAQRPPELPDRAEDGR